MNTPAEFDLDVAQRTLVVWCPDWPMVAMGVADLERAAVLSAGCVVACNGAARSDGVRRGQRRREAQQRCPSLRLIERDTAKEFRAFEVVLGAIEQFTPRVEVIRPGVCAVATLGPSRYFGGDEALARATSEAVADALDGRRCRVGIADGVFAATLAARSGVTMVPPGESAGFLSSLPIDALRRPELTDVLVRLGLTTLGAFAELDGADVIGRFASEGLVAHRLARGLDEHPLDTAPPAPDMAVEVDIEPPVDRVDQAAFLARGLADALCSALEHRGVSCTRIVVEVETEHGERIVRVWRNESGFVATAIVDRVRWQLDGWLNGPVRTRPTGGLIRLIIVPDEVVAAAGRQLGFWGGESEADTRAKRGIARVEALMSPEAVKMASWVGGRHGDGFRLVPAHRIDREAAQVGDDAAPWPGALPVPHPSVVHIDAHRSDRAQIVVTLQDRDGHEVSVTGRGLLSTVPARLSIDGSGPYEVARWAGPWLVEERWWDPERRQRLARVQLVTAEGSAHVIRRQDGRWLLEADYG